MVMSGAFSIKLIPILCSQFAHLTDMLASLQSMTCCILVLYAISRNAQVCVLQLIIHAKQAISHSVRQLSHLNKLRNEAQLVLYCSNHYTEILDLDQQMWITTRVTLVKWLYRVKLLLQPLRWNRSRWENCCYWKRDNLLPSHGLSPDSVAGDVYLLLLLMTRVRKRYGTCIVCGQKVQSAIKGK
jgi:hypothetical protein